MDGPKPMAKGTGMAWILFGVVCPEDHGVTRDRQDPKILGHLVGSQNEGKRSSLIDLHERQLGFVTIWG